MKKTSKSSDLEILGSIPVTADTILIKDQFSSYKDPKKKIFDLMKKGYLYPIRRGQYFNLKSKALEKTPYETIANSLYYPSYVSMEWALQYYGVIPERVISVTSVTLLRSRDLKTPFAPFIYRHISKNRYPVGFYTKINGGERFLIAKPEKALMDYVNIHAKKLVIKNKDDIVEFLENDLRLYLKEFLKITYLDDVMELLPFYHRNSKEYRILRWLIKLMEINN